MTIKTILLPIRESSTADSLMETAVSMAIRNNAHLDLLYVQNDPEHLFPFASFGVTTTMRKSIIESAAASGKEQGEALHQRFIALCERYNMNVLPRGSEPGKPSADFLFRQGARDELIAIHGRLADLIIVPKPESASPPPRSIEAALRDTGRPVIMVPREKVLDTPGKRLAIGWNSSKEAAQAISSVHDNLLRAEKVFVLCSESRMALPSNADDVCVYLRCHGISAETSVFSTEHTSVGEALLSKANEHQCDRLVVGGYSRSKLRDVIMGGVTGYLMENTDMPVLMVH